MTVWYGCGWRSGTFAGHVQCKVCCSEFRWGGIVGQEVVVGWVKGQVKENGGSGKG